MASPKPKLKRPCTSLNPSPTNFPNHPPIPRVSNSNSSSMDSLLALSDSSAFSLDLSFDRLLDSRASDSDKSDLIDRALNLGSVLLEAAKRSARKRASMHNALVWPLAPDLTIKGNMGLVFTNGDLKEVRDKVYREGPPAATVAERTEEKEEKCFEDHGLVNEVPLSCYLQNGMQKLHDMRKRARDIFWWPFTQHEIVPIENITVIDSRCGEKFAVHKAGSYDLITQQFDAYASWWTHGT
ncbi:hypothetical protein ACH5RR_009649 [Cinchona calisaya]|uniref:Uncharacterized protein n=1 Tax=Cinchona calisaya TaxID=153742 RepID=A0ABD3AHV7_9GENT